MAEATDADALMLLEEESLASSVRASKEEILQRIQNFPRGQFVITVDTAIIGVMYTRRTATNVKDASIHAPRTSRIDLYGENVQIMAINIPPSNVSESDGDENHIKRIEVMNMLMT